ncbi:hypothetical protein CI104_09635 [Citrobacter farmeri]|uniref:Uncharacterized protein n=1 Tax=Citrobacter farmeri TaxID=67824 RepID=A0ACA8D573_9ENTR|nr:hypothetical protein CI104_09635 [Citrobacter farmeri]
MKTGDPKGFQSSNLCASARLNKGLPKGNPFVFMALRIQLEYPLRISREKRFIFSRFSCQKRRVQRRSHFHVWRTAAAELQ